MPMIIYGAVMDLRGKGVSISLLGDAEATDIKVFLRTVEYDEFLSRFYDEVTLSARGMCLAAAAKMTQEDLFGSPRAVLELGLPEDDLAAAFKQHYDQLPLSDPGLLIVARADKTQDDMISMDLTSVIELGLPDEDSLAGLKKCQYPRLLQFSLKPGAETGIVTKGVFAAVGGRFGEVTKDPDSDQEVGLRWLDDGSESGCTKLDQLTSVVHSRDDLIEEWLLSDEGLLVAAKADKTLEDIVSMEPAAVIELGMSDEDSLAVLKKCQYSGFFQIDLKPEVQTGIDVTEGVFGAVDGRWCEVVTHLMQKGSMEDDISVSTL